MLRLIHTFIFSRRITTTVTNVSSASSFWHHDDNRTPLQLIPKLLKSFGSTMRFQKFIRGPWLCWRANPAGIPPTIAAVANTAATKILLDVRGKHMWGIRQGPEGNKCSNTKDEILAQDRSHRSRCVTVYVKRTHVSQGSAQVCLTSGAEDDLLGSFRGPISV